MFAAALAAALWLMAAPDAEAWWHARYSYHYGGYGGYRDHYNAWTGGAYHYGYRGYNAYTGRYGASRSSYNPYTGGYWRVGAVYNPYTGRYDRYDYSHGW
jgi:hypothetical protein